MIQDILNSLENIPIGDIRYDIARAIIEFIYGADGALTIFQSIIGIVVGIGLIVILYVICSYITMFQGRKAGLDNDWFAFIPVARSIYRLDMVGEDRWKIVFVGGLATIIKLIAIVLLFNFVRFTNPVISIIFDIIVLAYWGVSIYYTYIFNRKLYRLFGFNEHFSLINLSAGIACAFIVIAIMGGWYATSLILVALPVIAIEKAYKPVFNFITAFDNRCQAEGVITQSAPSPAPIRANAGRLLCTSGMYKDAEFQVESDFEIIIGRDSYFSSIVITEGADSVSRKHCGIRYNKAAGNYTVTDYSSNGTYIADTGERLQRNTPQTLSCGTSIYLGDRNNRFKLI